MEAVLARRKHRGLNEHAKIGPLAMAHLPVDGEKHRDRRVEEAEIPHELFQPPLLVLARNANGRV